MLTSLEGGTLQTTASFASGRLFLASYVEVPVLYSGFQDVNSRRLERGRDLGECVLMSDDQGWRQRDGTKEYCNDRHLEAGGLEGAPHQTARGVTRVTRGD